MKHAIKPEKQGVVTGTSEDANFPWTNLTDNNVRKKVGKAADGVQTVTLRGAISANAKALLLDYTNAETVVCTITLDSAEKAFRVSPAVDVGGGLVKLPVTDHLMVAGNVVLINGTTNYDGVRTLPSQAAGDAINLIITATYVAETFAVTDTACIIVESTTHTLETATRTYDHFWEEFTEQSGAHTATMTLTAATGETVEAGIFRAGGLVTLRNPNRDLNESKYDYSEVEQLHNGADYVIDLDVVREFSYSMDLTIATEFRNLMDLYVTYKKNPFAMLIADSLGDDNMYCIFGKFLSEPSGSLAYTEARTNVTIREAV